MFTGLVEKTGSLKKIERRSGGWRLAIESDPLEGGPFVIGESIAVQGVCLTVTESRQCEFTADLLDETMRRTALGKLKVGARVNLERALCFGDRLGGHIVTGHVDETGAVAHISKVGRDYDLSIACSKDFARQCVMKGSVAIQGVSLTITEVTDDSVSVNIIPHTWQVTSLSDLKVSDSVNLESDIIGKYVARYMSVRTGNVTEDTLRKAGFCV